MTELEGIKEAARREGTPPEPIEALFKMVTALGGMVGTAQREIPPGQEESFIAAQILIKRTMEHRMSTEPEKVASEMTAYFSRKTSQN